MGAGDPGGLGTVDSHPILPGVLAGGTEYVNLDPDTVLLGVQGGVEGHLQSQQRLTCAESE